MANPFSLRKEILSSTPFDKDVPVHNPFGFYEWSASWIWPAETSVHSPCTFTASLDFELEKNQNLRFHISADQRYELYLDTTYLCRGPELSYLDRWMFDTYTLSLPSGSHRFSVRIWNAGLEAGIAQCTYRPAFLFAAEGEFSEILNTGTAPWKLDIQKAYKFVRRDEIFYAPPRLETETSLLDTSWLHGPLSTLPQKSEKMKASIPGNADTPPAWILVPGLLPSQRETHVAWGKVRYAGLRNGKYQLISEKTDLRNLASTFQDFLEKEEPLTIEPHAHLCFLVDLERYSCAFPTLRIKGGKGAQLSLLWAEACYTGEINKEKYSFGHKGNRNEIEGKFFSGAGDIWKLDGREHSLDTAWWHAGRYILFEIQTAADPVTLLSASLLETSYPLAVPTSFQTSDSKLYTLVPLLHKSLQACSHETYMDCPYYERLQYVGDTRLESLVTMATDRDALLPKKAVLLFHWSRGPEGLTTSRFPSRLRQTIPPFSLWWINMLHDYAYWRRDSETVRECLSGAREIADTWLRQKEQDGLIRPLPGWNFSDWAENWDCGVAQGWDGGRSTLLSWQLILALDALEDLESHFGHRPIADLWSQEKKSLFQALGQSWDSAEGMYALDLQHKHFSEHPQTLAVLSGLLAPERIATIMDSLANPTKKIQTTIYYSHYYLEAAVIAKRMDLFFGRLKLWESLFPLGFVTTPEQPEPSRSDCHGWGAHPLFHFYASVLGIRPSEPGFRGITIHPQLGPLQFAKGILPHPDGDIAVEFHKENSKVRGKITLPTSVDAKFIANGEEISFKDSLVL